jgi:hypothetical protein
MLALRLGARHRRQGLLRQHRLAFGPQGGSLTYGLSLSAALHRMLAGLAPDHGLVDLERGLRGRRGMIWQAAAGSGFSRRLPRWARIGVGQANLPVVRQPSMKKRRIEAILPTRCGRGLLGHCAFCLRPTSVTRSVRGEWHAGYAGNQISTTGKSAGWRSTRPGAGGNPFVSVSLA